MKITLLMAITINGFIAGSDDDTDWVKDLDALYKTIADFGVIVMGKRTYDECVKYNVFPYKGALNIVMTHDAKLLQKSDAHALFTDAAPEKIVEIVKKKEFNKLLIIGGGHINAAFLAKGLIDEIILDLHPLIMSKGIQLFEGKFAMQKLELQGYNQINDQIVQIKYKVKQ